MAGQSSGSGVPSGPFGSNSTETQAYDARGAGEAQQLLGHSSPVVTMRYAHLSIKALQEAASAASDRLIDSSKLPSPSGGA
jgi:hypothetical protein